VVMPAGSGCGVAVVCAVIAGPLNIRTRNTPTEITGSDRRKRLTQKPLIAKSSYFSN
jgi:hypothetical protein